MKMSLRYRQSVTDARRIVVKMGSRVLVRASGRPDVRRIRSLIGELARLQRSNHEMVVVTSGAIGAGMEALGMKQRPKTLPNLQMAAAVGQSRLMSRYDDLFSREGCKVGQVLLTHGDFHHTIRLTNARRTIENMIRNRVVPVINENDVVADEEIRADLALGDNDLLASLVVKLIRADLLVMLTTADGLRAACGSSGRTRRVRYVEKIGRNILAMAGGGDTSLSRGGMRSKLKAARTAAKSGCAVVIADGRRPKILSRIMRGEDIGTMILASAF